LGVFTGTYGTQFAFGDEIYSYWPPIEEVANTLKKSQVKISVNLTLNKYC
jgi:hypothetical protein